MPTTEPFYERLPCVLDAQEQLLKSKSLAQLLCDQSNVEMEKKDANADFKRRLDAISTRMGELGLEVRTGREYREVPCTERADYRDGRVEIIRMDTGEVVRMRALEPHERQERLAFGARVSGSSQRADNTNAEPDHDEFKEKMQ